MKIAYDKMSTILEIPSDCAVGMIVENQRFLQRFLLDMRNTLEGNDSGFIFSKQDRIVAAPKIVDLVTDFIFLQLGKRTIMNKVISNLEQTALSGRFYQETQKLLGDIENFVTELTLDVPCDFVCEKQNIQGLLKGIGLSILDKYDSLEERILVYMDLVREYEKKELFVFYNLRGLISYDSLNLMVNTALEREHHILLVDCAEYPKLTREDRLIVDQDLCEI